VIYSTRANAHFLNAEDAEESTEEEESRNHSPCLSENSAASAFKIFPSHSGSELRIF
jgi:hypothetical protein